MGHRLIKAPAFGPNRVDFALLKDLESLLGTPERNNTPNGISATGHTGGLGYEHSSRIRWIGGGRGSFRRFGGDRGACAGGAQFRGRLPPRGRVPDPARCPADP